MRLPQRAAVTVAKAARRPRGFIEWTAPGEPFTFVVTRRLWPPFFSVLYFLPRVKMEITNDGGAIEYATAAFEVARYDGPIGEVPTLKIGWTDTQHHEIGPWATGDKRMLQLKIRSRSLPHAGTYVARVRISRLQNATPPAVAQQGGRVRVGTGEAWVAYLFEYFRVEPTSTVLTFWVVCGTLAAAAAALVTALVSLLR
jgi:hypothetical protein